MIKWGKVMKKFLITGATSFIGIELCRMLLNKGYSVVAVCRDGSAASDKLPLGVDIVTAEMSDYGHLYEQVERADVFVNLAWGGTGHDGRDSVEVQEKNVEYTLAAMQAAGKMGCEVFVEAGSQAEYGIVTDLITEETPCRPFSEYGRAKLKVKDAGFAISEATGMKYVHLRIFSLFGENDHEWTLPMSCIDRMLRGQTMELSACTQNWNFMYVKDAVRRIMRLCEHAMSDESFVHDIYNIASRDTRKLKDYVERMRELTGSSSELIYGRIMPSHVVSLQPDVTKTEKATGCIAYTPFDDVVRNIISIKTGTGYLIASSTDEPGRTLAAGAENPFHRIDSEFIRFILIGIINTLFGVGVYCLMIFFGLHYFIATLASNVLGVLFNFKTTGKFVFENEDRRLIFRFVLCYMLVYLINNGVIKAILLTGLNEYWAGILATPVVALCSFFMLKHFVYKRR